MEKITKKEAIQVLSKHYQIPIQTIVTFIQLKSGEIETTKKYQVQMYISPSEANKEMEKAALHGQNWKPILMTTTDKG
ncbi:unnamed protein product, partial [marine sediment metagenome]